MNTTTTTEHPRAVGLAGAPAWVLALANAPHTRVSLPAPLFLAVHAVVLACALVLGLGPREAVSSGAASPAAGQGVCVAPSGGRVAQGLHEGVFDRG